MGSDHFVKKRPPLIKTNPYLADPAKRRAVFVMTVISSSAIEGVRLSEDDLAEDDLTETRGIDSTPPHPGGARPCAPGRS